MDWHSHGISRPRKGTPLPAEIKHIGSRVGQRATFVFQGAPSRVSHRTEEAEVVAVQSRCEDANLLFEVGAKSVSAMRIEATGTILENLQRAYRLQC